jgi:hypothetical protein
MEKEQAEASFFILGTQLHETIEVSIVMDLDLDQALTHVRAGIDRELERVAASDAPRIETSKRGFDTMHDDAERMIGQWFWSVHPDSDKRLEIYDEYAWPPSTEHAWMRNDKHCAYPVWGSVDAVFHGKESLQQRPGRGAAILIVDWKSGASRQRSSDQLHFYMFGTGWVDARAAFHHLDKIQKRSIIQMADPYPGDDAVRQRILATEAMKDGILEDGHVPFNPSFLCNYCPVQHVCPADGDPRNRDKNEENLRRVLRLAKPMVEIDQEEREVA